ncbi:MAG: hypothetical protein ACOX6V_01970 [Patescibacteria group bacterium]|jgi:hypothetical protein
MAKQDVQQFLDKIKKMEKGEKLDLSSDEDLSIAIMNLISIEEHLFFSGSKTGKNEYFNLLKDVREMRKSLLKQIIKDYEGEVWCISKHLLAGSVRLMEVGTKMLGKGDDKKARGMFDKAYKLYSLFWGLNLGIVKTNGVKQSDSGEIAFIDEDNKPQEKISSSIFDKLGQIVQKAIDCCRE